MLNIFDYIDANRNITFHQKGVTEIDKVIFSRLSYFDFSAFTGMTIGEISKLYRFTTEYRKSRELMEALAKTKRYSSITVTDCICKPCPGIENSFTACTVRLYDDNYFISLCGTDKSVSSLYDDAAIIYGNL